MVEIVKNGLAITASTATTTTTTTTLAVTTPKNEESSQLQTWFLIIGCSIILALLSFILYKVFGKSFLLFFFISS